MDTYPVAGSSRATRVARRVIEWAALAGAAVVTAVSLSINWGPLPETEWVFPVLLGLALAVFAQLPYLRLFPGRFTAFLFGFSSTFGHSAPLYIAGLSALAAWVTAVCVVRWHELELGGVGNPQRGSLPSLRRRQRMRRDYGKRQRSTPGRR